MESSLVIHRDMEKSPSLENAAAQLISTFFAGRNHRTIRAYRQDLEDFSLFLSTEDVPTAARTLLSLPHGHANWLALEYRAHLVERQLSPATVNRRLAAIRSLTKLARTLGLVPWGLEVPNLKCEPYRDVRGPGVIAVRAMMSEIQRRTDEKGLRDLAILRLLFDLALRRGEVAALNIEDLDLESGAVQVLGKGRTQKAPLSLPEPTREALQAWLEVRGTEPGPLFHNLDRCSTRGRLSGRSIHRIVRKLGEKIGIKTRPHGLRHTAITAATRAAQGAGMGLEEVLDFSRHKDVRVLMVYRDRERDVQGKLAAMVAAHV